MLARTHTSFTLRQLGVICRIEDEYYAGIEFSEVSSRKSEQIRVLIEELVELKEERSEGDTP